MNYPDLSAYLNMHIKANVRIVINEELVHLLKFNKYHSISKLEYSLFKKEQEAVLSIMSMIKSINLNENSPLTLIIEEINSILNSFYYHNGILLHKRLKVRTQSGSTVAIEKLPGGILKEISKYITIQHSSIKCFMSKFHHGGSNVLSISTNEQQKIQILSKYSWDNYASDFLELMNALYEGGCIKSNIGKMTKTNFINDMATLYDIDLGEWESTLSKHGDRANPSKFTDYLRNTVKHYFNKKL